MIDPLVAELRDRREKAGLTQRQLADAMHCVQSHVSMLEAGRTDLQLDTLRRWAAALGVQPAWVPLTYETAPAAELPAGNGAHADAPASDPVPAEFGDRADVARCPNCGEPFTGFESEPGDAIGVNGYIEYLSVYTRWDPCGCTRKAPLKPAVARTLDVAERTVEKAREAR
jgi:transcriptional regulator with XRE-family HTH domain